MLLVQKKGCLFLEGDLINNIANYWKNKTDLNLYTENRKQRDGDNYHITVLTSDECKNNDIDDLIKNVPNDNEIFDFGIGKQTLGENICYYVVIYIPSLQLIRQKMGLPMIDFHITLGFSHKDIHDKPKNLSTICHSLDKKELCQKAELMLSFQNVAYPELAQQLYNNEYLSGLYFLAKYNLKNIGFQLTYEYIKDNVLSHDWILTENMTFVDKIINILNHGIKKQCDKIAKFYNVVCSNNVCKFSFTELPRNLSFYTDKVIGSSLPTQRDQFEAFVKLGVTDIVTIMEQPLSKHLYENINLNSHFIDVIDRTPPTVNQMLEIMQIIDLSNGIVLIHCMGGVGRTATALAAHLMWSENASKQEAKVLLEKRKTILSDSQEKFLTDWYRICNERETKEDKSHDIKKSTVIFPPVIMMVGYPSSGKSTMASSLQTKYSETIHRINQDEDGRKECELQAGKLSKKKGHTTILDRCNLTKAERKEWLNITHNQKTLCIFFAISIEECKWRIVRRKNHPTIKEGGGLRIIESLKGKLEEPTKSEGFYEIITVTKFDEVNALLAEWGCDMPDNTLDEPGLVKFPRTRHVANLGAASRDDLIMSKNEVAEFLNINIYVEEKIDGANLGISIKDDKVLVQNRSHYVNSSYHAQFKYLDKWIHQHSADLWQVLTPETHILFGEWVYAKHSIEYTELPNYFIAFDLYDRIEDKFWSRERLEKHLEGTGIPLIPLIANRKFTNIDELKALVKTKSMFYDGYVEGVYLRINDDDWLIKRGKIVRSDFLSGNEHWSKNVLTQNKLLY